MSVTKQNGKIIIEIGEGNYANLIDMLAELKNRLLAENHQSSAALVARILSEIDTRQFPGAPIV